MKAFRNWRPGCPPLIEGFLDAEADIEGMSAGLASPTVFTLHIVVHIEDQGLGGAPPRQARGNRGVTDYARELPPRGADRASDALRVHICVATLRTLPVLQHDPTRAEDLDTGSENHVVDDIRYRAPRARGIKKIVEGEAG